jgi:hypothetical protein
MYELYKPSAPIRLRDAARQNRWAARLRGLPEPRRFRFVRRLMAIDGRVGLELANRSIHSKPLLEALFSEAVRHSNPSTIREPISRLHRRLGVDRTLSLIRSEAAAAPDIARWAAYWLPAELDMADPSVAAAVRQLRADYPTVEPVPAKREAV